MAIKGKRRSRSGGGRRVTTAPRPQMVVPRRPLFQRTWFRVLLIGIVVAAVAVWGFFFVEERRETQAQQALQDEVRRTGALIEASLALVGQALPGGAGFQVLPDLSSSLAEMQTFAAYEEPAEGDEDEPQPGPTPTPSPQEPPKLNEQRIADDAEDWVASLGQTGDRLDRITTTHRGLRTAIEDLQAALVLYTDLAEAIPPALELDKPDMADEVSSLQEDLAAAQAAFDQAMFAYQGIRQSVGLVDPTVPGGIPGGIPGGGLPPGFPPQG